MAIVTGKNVRYVAMITTEVTDGPNANTIIGASATIGIVWLATTYGTNARSSRPEVDEERREEQAEQRPDEEAEAASRHV